MEVLCSQPGGQHGALDTQPVMVSHAGSCCPVVPSRGRSLGMGWVGAGSRRCGSEVWLFG